MQQSYMKSTASQDELSIELVTKLKELISNAESLPLKERCKSGDYKNNPDLRYPQTKSEYIVAEALNLLLEQD
jgi:hypothetical protein